MNEETVSTTRPGRRRASRAAGPALGDAATVADVLVDAPIRPVSTKVPAKTSTEGSRARVRLARRRPHASLVVLVSTAVLLVAVLALSAGMALLLHDQREAQAAQLREQGFVDTAKQTVVNMFSYSQTTIDESVQRFVDNTSGPLRDMMTRDNNAENLKALFRDTNATSEAVVSGAALEDIDEIASNASVLVAVRVTVTDVDGVNAPSKPYRLRVIVHEADNGQMSGYDIKWPDGGN